MLEKLGGASGLNSFFSAADPSCRSAFLQGTFPWPFMIIQVHDSDQDKSTL